MRLLMKVLSLFLTEAEETKRPAKSGSYAQQQDDEKPKLRSEV